MPITKFQRELIRDTIKENRTTNAHELVYLISDQLVDRYEDEYLECQLKKIGLETTKHIRAAVDEYLVKNRDKLAKEGLVDGTTGASK
ncbi:hypothetical protein [Butyrivibrio sp.]|uniref:hypothetical protein n=1 Tax=Butyrivibrio sp. TaxID=28121 RepID=UPI0025BF1100|nr:hypothetical protein [Butyrivibrio sp.]MBQ9306266.1 hypothetical protein [Butyrivibrio sp.]